MSKIRGKIIEESLLCVSGSSVACAMGLATMVSQMGIRDHNAEFALALLETNNDYVVEALVGDRDPFLLMRNITPSYTILSTTFTILSLHNPGSLNGQVLIALLGIIDIAYKLSADGFSIYPFTLSNMYNLGKYLDESADQFQRINTIILRILDNLYRMGMGSKEWQTRLLAYNAMQTRLAYFDATKNLIDIIPEELMVRVQQRSSVSPRLSGYTISKMG